MTHTLSEFVVRSTAKSTPLKSGQCCTGQANAALQLLHCTDVKTCLTSSLFAVTQELELARLKTALKALTASPPSQADSHPASAQVHQCETGVFSSDTTPANSISHRQTAASTSVPPAPARPMPGNRQTALHTQTAQQGSHLPRTLFQYPEDGSLHHGQHAAHMQQPSNGQDAYNAQQQQKPKQQAVRPANTKQTVSYHVEEPDSPLQSANADSVSANLRQSADASHEQIQPLQQSRKPPFAGCLLSETTFKRTTTPSRHGKAWSNVEEVTVRQIREIRQADAGMLNGQSGDPFGFWAQDFPKCALALCTSYNSHPVTTFSKQQLDLQICSVPSQCVSKRALMDMSPSSCYCAPKNLS